MQKRFSRTALLVGTEGMERLMAARVAVFGIGGVGGYAVEALARSGIGTLDLIDHDKVSLTNINRQIIALTSTVGKYKVDVAKERILDINPDAQVHTYRIFYMPQTAGQFDFTRYDYIVDAIDTAAGKIALIEQAGAAGTPIISSMGAGNKMDPGAFQTADIYETKVCPLARVMRRELKKRGIQKLKVVYSEEKPHKPHQCMDAAGREEAGFSHKPAFAAADTQDACRLAVPGSNAFVPPAAGLMLAGEVVKDLLAGTAG